MIDHVSGKVLSTWMCYITQASLQACEIITIINTFYQWGPRGTERQERARGVSGSTWQSWDANHRSGIPEQKPSPQATLQKAPSHRKQGREGFQLGPLGLHLRAGLWWAVEGSNGAPRPQLTTAQTAELVPSGLSGSRGQLCG